MAWYGLGGKASVDEDDMKTQVVNEVVCPTVTAGYKGRYNLSDTLDKFGKVKDFMDHDDTEMIVPTTLNRPGPNMATRPSWPKLPNFGVRPNKYEELEKPKPSEEIPAAEDSSKKPNNFWQDEDYVDSTAPTTNVGNKVGHTKVFHCDQLEELNHRNNLNKNVGTDERSSTEIKPTNYRGTAMDEHQFKQSYGANNNSDKVKESEQRPKFPNRNGQHNISETNPYEHEKPNISDGGHIKKQNMEIAGFDSAPMHRTNGLPNINWRDQDDESKKYITEPTPPRTFVSNPGGAVKPNISIGWQDYYYNGTRQRNVNYPQGEYNYNKAHRWKEITPNPPPQLQYGGGSGCLYPNYRPVYRRAVIDSKWAEKKYNGILLPERPDNKSNFNSLYASSNLQL